MTYYLYNDGTWLRLLHEETDRLAGFLELCVKKGGFDLYNALSIVRVGFVSTLDEAAPTLATYFEKRPPRWARRTKADPGSIQPAGHYKSTVYGDLTVEWRGPEGWIAYRDDHPLQRDDEIEIFKTADEAKRAADLHLCDGFPSSVANDDGYSWYTTPGTVRRVHYDRMASERYEG